MQCVALFLYDNIELTVETEDVTTAEQVCEEGISGKIKNWSIAVKHDKTRMHQGMPVFIPPESIMFASVITTRSARATEFDDHLPPPPPRPPAGKVSG